MQSFLSKDTCPQQEGLLMKCQVFGLWVGIQYFKMQWSFLLEYSSVTQGEITQRLSLNIHYHMLCHGDGLGKLFLFPCYCYFSNRHSQHGSWRIAWMLHFATQGTYPAPWILCLTEVALGKELALFSPTPLPPVSLSFSPSGLILALGPAPNRKAYLWIAKSLFQWFKMQWAFSMAASI